jgi:hypothetical protein
MMAWGEPVVCLGVVVTGELFQGFFGRAVGLCRRCGAGDLSGGGLGGVLVGTL